MKIIVKDITNRINEEEYQKSRERIKSIDSDRYDRICSIKSEARSEERRVGKECL